MGPTQGCGGAVAPKPPSLESGEREWLCGQCGCVQHDQDMPLDKEAWLTALVLDHDACHGRYTHEHFVATSLLAAQVLGPRHWTVDFMVSLLLENAWSKADRGFRTVGPALLYLAKFCWHWASDIMPAKQRTAGFTGLMLQCVRSLQRIGMAPEAAALACLCVDGYRNYWGSDDDDACFLNKVACMCQDEGIISRFSWGQSCSELARSCISTSEGKPDNGRITRTLQQLRNACDRRLDPRSTY